MRVAGATYVLGGPTAVEDFLIRRAADFALARYRHLRQVGAFFGHGIPASEGEAWLQQRRRVQRAFDGKHVAHRVPAIARCADRHVAALRPGEPCDIHAAFMAATLDVAMHTVFGTEEPCPPPVCDALESTLYLLEDRARLATDADTPEKQTFRDRVARLDAHLSTVIAARRAAPLAGGHDVLSVLLASDTEQAPFTDEQIRDELVTGMRSSHKNTATTLAWTAWLLASHPAICDQLRTELRDRLGTRPIAPDDLARLPLTVAVLNEGMRLYPLYPVIVRLARRDTEIGGFEIPAGSSVIAAVWSLHRDPRWFADPTRFLPARWLDGLATRLPRGAFLPFGIGARMCNAQEYAMAESIILLASLVRRFAIELAPGPAVVRTATGNGLWPAGGVRVILTPA